MGEFETIFLPHKQFNPVQSACFEAVFHNDCNVVVGGLKAYCRSTHNCFVAPTASGKTIVLLLAVCRLLMTMRNAVSSCRGKVIYMAPAKVHCCVSSG